MEMEQEQDKDPKIDLTDQSHWSTNVQKTITELQQNAGSVRHYLQHMHLSLTLLKSQVNETDFDKIHKAVKLPQTTVRVVRSLIAGSAGPSNVAPAIPPPAGSQGLSVYEQIIHDNLPRPDHFINTPAVTGLLGALVYYVLMLHLVPNHKLHTG